MALKAKLCLSLLLLSVFVLCAVAVREPELKSCKRQCEVQRQFDEKQKQECKSKCEDYYKGKESEEGGKEEERRPHGRHEGWSVDVDPEKKLRQCQRQCESEQQGQHRELCRLKCQERYKEERGEGEGESSKKRREKEEGEKGDEHPYVFEDEHFTTKARTEHGKILVLQRFHKRSELLRGLENYRIEVLEADPRTFVIPKHVDADAVYFVAKGTYIFALS